MPDLKQDPVCGMAISLGDVVASAVIDERRFYFCCLRCHGAFLDTPHRCSGWAGDPPRMPRGQDIVLAHARSIEPTATGPRLASCHFAS